MRRRPEDTGRPGCGIVNKEIREGVWKGVMFVSNSFLQKRWNLLIDGRGSRRRMRGRLDVVERDGVQGQGAMLVV
jgi:hypothetical protein